MLIKIIGRAYPAFYYTPGDGHLEVTKLLLAAAKEFGVQTEIIEAVRKPPDYQPYVKNTIKLMIEGYMSFLNGAVKRMLKQKDPEGAKTLVKLSQPPKPTGLDKKAK